MNNRFDELAKGLAQSATRRQALKKFGVGLAGLALACFGLANKAEAAKGGCKSAFRQCDPSKPGECCGGCVCFPSFNGCIYRCVG